MVSSRDTGSLTILALVIMVGLCLLGTTLMKIAVMEARCSQNDYRMEQARQSVEACIDLNSESIYQELSRPENLVAEQLPDEMDCSYTDFTIQVGGDISVASAGLISKSEEVEGVPGFCIYQVPIHGEYMNAKQDSIVELVFMYEGGNQIPDADGTSQVVPRVYMDRGQVVSYRSSF
ncbi:MAG: PilX N-terminal domain-containing pilus assembly protein [Syntrophomonadaceae bacterium]